MSWSSTSVLFAAAMGVAVMVSAIMADNREHDDVVLFVSDRAGQQDIYALTVGEGTIRRLTDSQGADFDPVWSPDGMTIAFTSRRDGGAQLYWMNADGSNPQWVGGPAPGISYGGRWHPDGTHLAFTSTRTNPAGLFSVAVDSGETREFPGAMGYPRHYQWSARGDRLWLMERDADQRLVELSWPEGERRVLVGEQDNPGNLGFFSISPDDRFMAFTAGRGRQLRLYLMSLDDGESRLLENVEGNISHMVWAPDGESLAYVASATHRGDPARNHLFVLSMSAPDAVPRVVAASPADDERPVWLDSERLVFVSFREGDPRLFLVSVTGEDAVMISEGPGQDGWPVARWVH